MANIPVNEIRLICHPMTPPVTATHLDVAISASGTGRLSVRFTVAGDVGMHILPEPLKPVRADRLWETTCFELFVKRADDECYFEYNFSPSTQWALYRFSDYRKGMAEEMIARPRIACDYSESQFVMNTEFNLPDAVTDGSLMIGVSAVIEERSGTKSYWALTHPSGEPDFHHKDCFAVQLDAPRSV